MLNQDALCEDWGVERWVLSLLVIAVFLATERTAHCVSSDWIEAPHPAYPLQAALKGHAGEVTLRAALERSGRVKQVTVKRPSGDAALDFAARASVLTWKLNPQKVTSTDLREGRTVVVVFEKHAKDQAIALAVLKRAAKKGSAWKSGGTIEYPSTARDQHQVGTLLLLFTIGRDCHPRAVQLVKSSGNPVLDQAAMIGIQTWTTYPEWVGFSGKVPVTFTMTRR